MDKVRVAVNGYGTIGRRVADAVLRQDDMELVGVTKATPDFRCLEAEEKGIRVFSVSDKSAFDVKGFSVEGNLMELLDASDVVVDCTPKNSAYIELYRRFPSLFAIFQGGEKHSLTGFSFNSNCNYNRAFGMKYARVVSCNTTALCRVLSQIDGVYGVKKVRVAIARRSVDPGEGRKDGLLNAWEPALEYPSHHAVDVKTVMPKINIVSLAGIAPMTIMHGHMMFVELMSKPGSSDEVSEMLSVNPRIRVISGDDGFSTTAQIKDYAESLNDGNTYEVCVWKDGIGIDDDGELGMHVAIDQQADVIPENVDAIRAMLGIACAEDSMAKTNSSLGIGRKLNRLVSEKRIVA